MSRKEYLLTKSKYIRGLQCEKALYLDVHNPKAAFYNAETLAKFRQGRSFEYTFKDTFPDGIDISAKLRSKINDYPVLTGQLLSRPGEVTLFEAGFIYDEVLVLADVVCKHENGEVNIYEVKNGNTVSQTFRNDVAVQHYVIGHALPSIQVSDLFCEGLTLKHFYLLYNDGTGGFVKDDQLESAREQVEVVRTNVERFKQVVQLDEPTIGMGDYCDIPYECPYKRYCRRGIRR